LKVRFAIFLILATSLANGAILVTEGNNSQDFVNVLIDKGETGLSVTGRLSGFADLTVEFTSSQQLINQSNGQAHLESVSDPLTVITISLANGFRFRGLVFNASMTGNGPKKPTTSPILLTADSNASPFYSATLGKGNNYFTVEADEPLTSLTIYAPSGFSALRQVRMSGVEAPVLDGGDPDSGGAPIPEPATWTLFAFGAALILTSRQVRKS
jgi:hypothetical protein